MLRLAAALVLFTLVVVGVGAACEDDSKYTVDGPTASVPAGDAGGDALPADAGSD